MGRGGNSNGRDPWLSGVHVEGDHSGGKVNNGVLCDLLGSLVDAELHVEVTSAQVGQHQPVVSVS